MIVLSMLLLLAGCSGVCQVTYLLPPRVGHVVECVHAIARDAVTVIDLSTLSDETRAQFARQVQQSDDFILPHLSAWNYDPCDKHTSIEEGSAAIPPCQKCGIIPRKHQRIGAAWAFFQKKVLVADQTGLGKSGVLAATVALCYESGELTSNRKVLFIVNAPSIMQWKNQLYRMMPNASVVVHQGVKSKRIARLMKGDWQIALVTPQTFNNDLELFRSFNIYFVACDDVDPLRSPKTRTAYSIKQVCYNAERVMIISATPLNKKLTDLYSVLEPLGGREILGAPTTFERRYIKYHFGYSAQLVKGGGTRQVMQKSIIGYRNIPELIEKLQPISIRRTASDVEDAEMPVLVPNHVYLEMYPRQREKYEQLKKGVIQILKEDGSSVTRTKAQNAFMLGGQICGGLSVLGEQDGPGTSVKLDWVENALTGDLADEKVVVFGQFKNTIRSLQARLDLQGIRYGTIWGEDSDKASRQMTQETFWNDPECRVLLGTKAVTASLNLQNARHLIALDTLPSPSVMTQLAGRIQRIGSSHPTVYFHSLLCEDSQEENYLIRLQKEQALSDFILDGSASELYNAGMTPQDLLRLITG